MAGQPAFNPEQLSPADLMQATLHRRPFRDPAWIFEDKLDGFRAFVRKAGARVELLSRNGRSMAEAFPEIMRAITDIRTDAVLDAELVVPDDKGMPSFERLRRRAVMKLKTSIDAAAGVEPAMLCIFDCLAFRRRDMRTLPLLDRKAMLERLVRSGPALQLVGHVETEGEIAFAAAVEFGAEGVVAKRANSAYRAGRSSAWLKIKNPKFYRQEAITGFRTERRS